MVLTFVIQYYPNTMGKYLSYNNQFLDITYTKILQKVTHLLESKKGQKST